MLSCALIGSLLSTTACAGSGGTPMSFTVEGTTAPHNRIVRGNNAQLCYHASRGSIALVNNGVGAVSAGECVTVSPGNTTTYTIRAAGPRQSARTFSATIAVAPPPAQASISLTSVAPANYSGTCPTSIAFVGKVAVKGSGSKVVYQLVWNGGRGPQKTATLAADTSAPVGESVTLKTSQSGWGELHVTSPTTSASKRATFVVHCLAVITSERIWALAQAARCLPGSGYPGNGCARTVNKIVAEALGHTIPPDAPPFVCGGANWDPVATHTCSETWVPDVVQMIVEHGAGRQLKQSETQPGDIAVQDGNDAQNGMNHIGFCEDTGCTTVLSNMSSTGRLCGETNATMSNNGYPYPPNLEPTFYRIGA